MSLDIYVTRGFDRDTGVFYSLFFILDEDYNLSLSDSSLDDLLYNFMSEISMNIENNGSLKRFIGKLDSINIHNPCTNKDLISSYFGENFIGKESILIDFLYNLFNINKNENSYRYT